MSEDRARQEQVQGEPPTPAAERPTPGSERAGAGDEQPGAPRRQHPEAWQRDQMAFDPLWKSPTKTALLSVIPGAGQLYIGYYVRGFVIAGLVLMFFFMADSFPRSFEGVGVLGGFFTWIFGIIDAGRMAALYNHAAAGREVLEMPEDFRMPRLGGSIGAGLTLLVFGGIALSNTLYGFSLDWLEDWWPIFPFALGLYLLVRGVLDYVHERERTRADAEPAPAAE